MKIAQARHKPNPCILSEQGWDLFAKRLPKTDFRLTAKTSHRHVAGAIADVLHLALQGRMDLGQAASWFSPDVISRLKTDVTLHDLQTRHVVAYRSLFFSVHPFGWVQETGLGEHEQQASGRVILPAPGSNGHSNGAFRRQELMQDEDLLL